ncbi:MAG TPA: hypothetical protein VHY59_13230, partial [Chthoniobacterales bacterium]|nr:hypothetical protein [Chthoniobacterales bacterium]
MTVSCRCSFRSGVAFLDTAVRTTYFGQDQGPPASKSSLLGDWARAGATQYPGGLLLGLLIKDQRRLDQPRWVGAQGFWIWFFLEY